MLCVSKIEKKVLEKMKVDFKIRGLKNGEKLQIYEPERETGVVFLLGSCNVEFETGEKFTSVGDRKTVFEKPGYAVYVPREIKATFEVESEELEVAVISVEAKKKLNPFIVNPDYIVCQVRGKKEWKRSVYDLIGKEELTDSLYIGETYHTDGVWSGYPPHKHDIEIENIESANEEIYFIKVNPNNGFGVFINYTEDDKKKSTIVYNNDKLYVKEGYHSIISTPGFEFYYLWALSSRDKRFICSEDVNYKWLEEKEVFGNDS